MTSARRCAISGLLRMTVESRIRWTEQDFEELSWHDNYIHGFSLVAGEHGAGELVIDLDYILDWQGRNQDGQYQFRIAPAELTFAEVTNLNFSLDYASVSAAMGPFSIDGIERHVEARERYNAIVWTINVSFPAGQIIFEASGFRQVLRGTAQVTDQQFLTREQRSVSAG